MQEILQDLIKKLESLTICNEDLEQRIIELEKSQERIFAQHISLIGSKTSVIEIVTQVVAEEFSLDPFVFTNFQAYKIKIGKANNKSKLKLEDKENITQACYWLCSILHHWFSRSISWLSINFYWYRPYYVQRYQHLLVQALEENGTPEQKKIRERYYRILKEIKNRLQKSGIYNQSYEPTFDLAETLN